MIMKKLPIIVFFIISFALVIGVRATEAEQKMHPTFKTLLELRPRDGPIIAPSIPRITPNQAYNLLMQGKAILIEAGPPDGQGHGIVGAQFVQYDDKLNPGLIDGLKQINDKLIILFCK